MNTFNVHYVTKDNKPMVIAISGVDKPDDARTEARRILKNIAYIKKVKVSR